MLDHDAPTAPTATAVTASVPTSDLRTLVLSHRHLWDVPWTAYCTEFETVLADVLAADVVAFGRSDGWVADALAPRFRLRNLAARWPPLRSYTLDEPPHVGYDLAVVVVNDLRQLGVLAAIPSWRSLARTFIAYVFEVWPVWIGPATPVVHEVVDHLDHLYVGIRTGAEALETTTRTPVTFLPPAVDVLAATVYAGADDRRIDVSNRGRRDAAQHEALLGWSHRTGAYYEFDTLLDARVADGREHRHHFYEQTARTGVFVANPARFDRPELSAGATEVGLRYIEAMACGTVIVGGHADSTALRRVLVDPPGFVEFPIGAQEVPRELRELVADPHRSVGLGLGNRAVAVGHHDVLHRWDVIASGLGIGTTAGARARRDALAAAAEAVEN